MNQNDWQNNSSNRAVPLARPIMPLAIPVPEQDRLSLWINVYFDQALTVGEASRKAKYQAINRFLMFLIEFAGSDKRLEWTPRLSQSYKAYLSTPNQQNAGKRLADRTINVNLTHVKAFSKWINGICLDPQSPFAPSPLGDPMKAIKLIPIQNPLEIERALSEKERFRMLDAADLLLHGGRSRDRRRHTDQRPPQRKNYRPYRNRAILYLFIGTGMRIGGVVNLNLGGLDLDRGRITTEEKGGKMHTYRIGKQHIPAIREYLDLERPGDAAQWPDSAAMFLPASQQKTSGGRLSRTAISKIWSDVATSAGINKSPHSARHAMGKNLAQKPNGIVKVQAQLGHSNIAFSACYSRPTEKEIMDDLESF